MIVDFATELARRQGRVPSEPKGARKRRVMLGQYECVQEYRDALFEHDVHISADVHMLMERLNKIERGPHPYVDLRFLKQHHLNANESSFEYDNAIVRSVDQFALVCTTFEAAFALALQAPPDEKDGEVLIAMEPLLDEVRQRYALSVRNLGDGQIHLHARLIAHPTQCIRFNRGYSLACRVPT